MTEDAPLKAELIESNPSSVTKEFNIVLGTTLAISLVFLFLSAVFGDAFVNLVADEEVEQGIRARLGAVYTTVRNGRRLWRRLGGWTVRRPAHRE